MSKSCAWCHLNTGACWAGGLILALVIFVALFIVSIALADFCYVGPGPVMAAARDNNESVRFNLLSGVPGENPMAKDVDDMAAAVANLTDATASLTSLPVRREPQYGARGL